jgi:hypothetical protein
MFARVVTFAGGDPTRVDEVIAAVRDRVEEGAPALADASSFWMLVDRKKARMLGVSLFDDRETLRRGSKALEGLGHPAPEAGGEIVSIDVFEIPVVYERPDRAAQPEPAKAS